MKELKNIFTEIGQSYKTVWSRKKHFIHIMSVLLIASIVPFILLEFINISVNSGLIGINNIELVLYGTLFIVLISAITFALGTVGFVASIRSVVAHKREPLKKIFIRGAKKIFPVMWLGIITALPFGALAAAATYFKLGNLGVVLVFLGLVWMMITYFAKFFILFDDKKVGDSLHKGVVFFVKNTSDIIIRAFAVLATIIVPVLLFTTLIEMVHLYVIKSMYGIPTIALTRAVVDGGLLPTSGVIVGIIFMVISMAVTLYLFLPLIMTYIVKTFDALNEKTKESKRLERGVEKTIVVLYALAALISISIFLMTLA